MEFTSFKVVKISDEHLSPLVGGTVDGVTASGGGLTISKGSDDDSGGGDKDTGKIIV